MLSHTFPRYGWTVATTTPGLTVPSFLALEVVMQSGATSLAWIPRPHLPPEATCLTEGLRSSEEEGF